jgi:hypothetical protein
VPTPTSAESASVVGENVAVPSCRFQITLPVVASGKTVREPSGPSVKLATGVAEARSWARIFREMAVMLCVVKRLTAAMSLGFAPPAIAPGRASSNALRYAFSASSFVWP